jgi:hypothetical protein
LRSTRFQVNVGFLSFQHVEPVAHEASALGNNHPVAAAAQDATGYDLRPLRAQEPDLINLADAAKASPVSALSIGERLGLLSPPRQFNGNMRDALAGVAP